MLKPDQAQAELARIRIENWLADRLKAVGKLPSNLARPGRFLLGRDPVTGKEIDDWQKRNDYARKIPGELAKLRPAERTRLFATLFPHLGEYLEATWQLAGRLPYSIGHARKAFRAPGEEQLFTQVRWDRVYQFIHHVAGYDPTPAWLAAWAPYVSGGSVAGVIGLILAATIDKGGPQGEEVFETLIGSINRTHPIGAMGQHVIRGLLVAARPEGWDAIEKLLLAAQRQEGLRQSILETIDEAHPDAFRRMLRIVLDQNLLRFSASLRAAMVWFGLEARENDTVTRYKRACELALLYLNDEAACQQALASEDGDALYLALWALGFDDVTKAVPEAAKLLQEKRVERRDLGVRFLAATQMPDARQALRPVLADPDLRVAIRAFYALNAGGQDEKTGDLFEPLQKLLERLPEKPTQLKPIGDDLVGIFVYPQAVADVLPQYLGSRPIDVVLPYLPRMGDYQRGHMAQRLAEAKPLTPALREALFQLIGDRVGWVRGRVLEAIKKLTLEPDEALLIEALLTRKAADLREQALGLLAKQKTEPALASADRLLASKNANQRLAGLELLRHLVTEKKSVAACRERAGAWQEKQRKISEYEQAHLDVILGIHRDVPTLANGLGLFDPAKLTPAIAPKKRDVKLVTPAATGIITALDEWVQANAEEMIVLDGQPVHDESGSVNPRQMPLGAITHELPSPNWSKPRDEDLARMPLRDKVTAWWQNRPAKLRDTDGLDLVRARCVFGMWDNLFQPPQGDDTSSAVKAALKKIFGGLEKGVAIKTRGGAVRELLDWLTRQEEPAGVTDFLLDAVETSFSLVPAETLNAEVPPNTWNTDWRDWAAFEFWPNQVRRNRGEQGETWTAEQKGRYYQLCRWLAQPVPTAPLRRLDWDDAILGYELGLANLDDLTEQLIGPRPEHGRYYHHTGFPALTQATVRPEPELFARRPDLRDLVEQVRQRILEVELARGDLPTAASAAALSLNSVVGLDLLTRLLAGLGKHGLQRQLHGTGRAQVFSLLIRNCYPGPDDTPEAFSARIKDLVKKKQIAPEVPLQLAFFNPRWVYHVAHSLGVPTLPEGVWWFFGHMGREPNLPESLEASIRAARADAKTPVHPWSVMIEERTTLSDEDRAEGAIDTAWFHRAHEAVGAKRWKALAEASKFGGYGNDYRNPQRLSEVLLGKASRSELLKEVRDRKLKGSVRLLGLMPLAKGEKRDADLHQRWKAINEYRKYARSLSPMSREDAIRTGEIGLANLARTAGYADPNRLIWAMEWNEIQDLAAGPVVASAGDVSVTLTLDDQANPVTTIQRGDKILKAIPPKVRKDKKIAALVDRRAALKQQASRIRWALEAMLIRGDTIRGEELPALMKHPLVAKNLSRLLLIGEGIAGYPVAEGQALEDHQGKLEPIKKDEVLRLAHPLDLLDGGDWHDWQAHCFRIERVQPFKQVFRELYLLTDAERADKTFSRRYSGQQVNPNQAMALFGTRGWRTRDGVTKTFSEQDLVAEMSFQSGFGTPLEVEGLTVDRLRFHRRGSWQSVPLAEVPRRIFSEVMRDLDLVVSVAHVGGVDPEASASTIEMRAALARELLDLLNLKNVKVKEPHLLIDGHLSKYSLHLGSGTVHKMPGGALCIVAVPAQHRGRIFLPFADNDPRTAEVIAKLLMLARDDEIQDPGILDQLRA